MLLTLTAARASRRWGVDRLQQQMLMRLQLMHQLLPVRKRGQKLLVVAVVVAAWQLPCSYLCSIGRRKRRCSLSFATTRPSFR